MIQETINNINIDKLPDDIKDVILREYALLPLKSKLIVYAKLLHGHMFTVNTNDLFNIKKQAPGSVYRLFIKTIKNIIQGNNMNVSKKKPIKYGKRIDVAKNKTIPKKILTSTSKSTILDDKPILKETKVKEAFEKIDKKDFVKKEELDKVLKPNTVKKSRKKKHPKKG